MTIPGVYFGRHGHHNVRREEYPVVTSSPRQMTHQRKDHWSQATVAPFVAVKRQIMAYVPEFLRYVRSS